MIATGTLIQKMRAPRPLAQVAAGDRAHRGQPAGDGEEDGQRLAAFAQLVGAHDDRERGRAA